MNAAQWRTAQALFLAARDLSAAARDAYLRSACPEDEHVRRAVLRMLVADAADGVLDRPAPLLSFLPAPDESDVVEERVGPYLVMGEIGRGGMGVVYRAYDPRLRREVALKFLPSGWTDDRDAKARFIGEARAASALDHPHHCPVYDVGSTDDGRLYIAMAYCAGGSLASRLAEGPLAVEDAVRIAAQVASALHRAHEAGIVHRDIKPANIAFTEHGDARVLDFGVALLGTDEWAIPRVAAGTPAYMAPEQVRGEAVDRRTDVWALGVVLYEMLTGQRPFSGDRGEAAAAIVAAAPDDARAIRPDVPASLAAAVRRAMSRDPAHRFATASELAQAITSAIATDAPGARDTGRFGRRRTMVAAGLLVVAAAGVFLASHRDRLTTSVTPPDQRTVAVLPFRVSGEPGIGYLREGMVDLLAAKLTGDGGLRAADPRAVYATWRRVARDDGDDIPRDSAVALARALGAGNVLLGSIVGTAANIVVSATIVDSRGRVVGQATAQGDDSQLSSLVDRLTAELLSVSSGEEPQRLATLTSTSLPALRAYLEGQAAYRRGQYADALEKFGRAIDLDSTFALAGLGLSLADGWVGTRVARDRGRAVAWRWRDRLSARDRALLVAQVGPAYPRESTVRERLAATEAALRLAPDAVELWNQLGDLHLHFGRQLGTAWESEAERGLRRAVQTDSTFAAPIHHLVTLYARQGRSEDLRAVVRATRALELEGPTADYIRWRTALALGGPRPGAAALDSMAAETIGWIGLITQDDGVDRRLGEHALRLRLSRPGTGDDRFERHLSVHAVALNAGRPGEALSLSDSLRDVQPDAAFHLRLRILSALYGDGDWRAAERAAASLGVGARAAGAAALDACVLEQWRLASGGLPADDAATRRLSQTDRPASERLCAATIEAMHASRQRDASARDAIGRLDSLVASGLAELYIGDGHLDYGHIALARLLETSGDSGAALAALRRRPYFIGWQPFLAASLRHEGRLAAAIGDRAGAIRAYEHYLALRHDPEPALRAAADSVRNELAVLRTSR